MVVLNHKHEPFVNNLKNLFTVSQISNTIKRIMETFENERGKNYGATITTSREFTTT